MARQRDDLANRVGHSLGPEPIAEPRACLERLKPMNSLPPPAAPRLGSIDAYRGFVMFLMMAEVLELRHLAQAFPDNATWQFLAYHQTHVEWAGCSLHDMIQPSFTFLVGTALPFSMASRLALGQSALKRYGHAALRALILI